MSEYQVIYEETAARLTAFAVEVQRELLRAGLPAYSGLTDQPGAHVTVNTFDARGVEVDWHCHDGLITPMFEATADNIVADDVPGPNPSRDWWKSIKHTMTTSIDTILTAAGWQVSALDNGALLVAAPADIDQATAMTEFRMPSPAKQARTKLEFLGLNIQDELAFAGLPLVPSFGGLAPAEAIGAQVFVAPGEPTGVLVGWQYPGASGDLTHRTVLAAIAEILTAAGWPVTEHGTDHLLVRSKGEFSPWHAWHHDQSERRDQRWRDAVNARNGHLPDETNGGRSGG